MLSWWLGRGAEEDHLQNDHPEQDAPETPAPVFAARALKSAIFGTPAAVSDDTMYEIAEEIENIAPRPRHISPTKPPGILLTPGTATSRRKTVSFGNEVEDKEEKLGEGGASNQWPSERRVSGKASRKTTLTKQLEEARESKSSKTSASKSSADSKPQSDFQTRGRKAAEKLSSGSSRKSKSERSNQELLQEMVAEPSGGDITLDLNEPRSQSGQYWKAQFQTYHDEATAELSNLLKYKHLAKTYAKERDSRALDLHQKLREEQRKVLKMEEHISMLSARIATAGLEGVDDESPELIKELARQTALALQYKSQVEEFRAALEDNESSPEKRNSHDGRILTSPRTEQTTVDTNRELKKAREQLREMQSLRTELDNVRKTLYTAEKTTRKLQDENTKLTQELLHADLRLETLVEKSEKRRQSSEEQRQKKDEALKTLQKDYDNLKEHAKSQRRDAEQMLKKRHDQAVEFRKEIASLQGAESSTQELQLTLQKKTKEHDQIVTELQAEIARLKAKGSGREDIVVSKANSMPLPERVAISSDASQTRESLIPVSSQPISRPLKTVASARQLRSDTPAGSPQVRSRSSHSALSEIVNQASVDTVPPSTSGPVQYTPMMKRFSDLSLQSPSQPSQEPTPHVNNRAVHQRNCQPSPMPSMFNIPSSPPKPVARRPRASDELPRKRSSNDLLGRRQGNINSSHFSGSEVSRARSNLPPERAAAARARLEQKNAEKKRAKLEGEKENMRG
ncbi:hypothetical protein LSUE1_G000956 [Lachnellula suecica]|uniref:Spindle pole body-associated protein cut12 domain-containing protein n=1 Tax=Lachnellula suecica TaxID=602035 RepID=A0A8T9CF95_9HELO|nr:hypothetical protein LSUE1_G000956 [Lachnellula suecica]